MERFSRVKLLIGEEGYEKLKNAKVAVFGIGGVGGFTAEALCRSGIGAIDLFDNDAVEKSNLNRQIIATENTVGKKKVEAMKERLESINPAVKIQAVNLFFMPETSNSVDFSKYDYVVDAVDTVTAKIEIIKRAYENSVPVISCMGTGGKLNIESLKISEIEKTKVCPLARVMRKELKDRNIKGVKVVYSEEEQIKTENKTEQKKADGKTAPPSMIFVPAAAGLLLAQAVVTDICGL